MHDSGHIHSTAHKLARGNLAAAVRNVSNHLSLVLEKGA